MSVLSRMARSNRHVVGDANDALKLAKVISNSLADQISDLIDLKVAVKTFEVSPDSKAENLAELNGAGFFGLAHLERNDGVASVHLNAEIVNNIVDLRMGGRPQQIPLSVDRSLTSIDRALTEEAARRCLTALLIATEDYTRKILQDGLELFRMEPAADLLTKTFVQNELFVARFDLVIGSDERRGKVHIAVPYEVLDTLVLGNGQERALETADHSDWEHQLKAVASFAEVTVRGVIHREQIAREDLAALAVGQFIRLPRARMSAVDIMVVASDGDKKIATGHLGAYRERKVLKVLDGPSADLQRCLYSVIRTGSDEPPEHLRQKTPPAGLH